MAGIPGSQTGAGETVVGGGNLGAELSYQGDSSCGGWDKQEFGARRHLYRQGKEPRKIIIIV